jgi:transmembrane sensor
MDIQQIGKILSGESTEAERKLFERWLFESDDNREYFEKLRIIWQRCGTLKNEIYFDAETAQKAILIKIADKRKSRKIVKYWLGAVASLLLLIGLTFVWYNNKNDNFSHQIFSAGNEVKMIILPDNSHVWLNRYSTLEVPDNLSGKIRKVWLKGEAYFEIAHNERRPFKITSGNTITEILGTTFNINLDTLSGDVKVIVKSGKVALYNKKNPTARAILTADQKGQYHESSHVIEVSSNTDQNFLAWKTGLLIFSDTPLAEVCKKLGQYYNKNITADESIAGISITGTFRNEKLENILTTLAMTLDVNVSVNNNTITIQK